MTQIVKPLRSGQITIPALMRQKLGIDDETMLKISLIEGELRIKPVRISTVAGETAWFKKLYDQFSEVRKEAKHLSPKEVEKTIESAVKAVRKSHA